MRIYSGKSIVGCRPSRQKLMFFFEDNEYEIASHCKGNVPAIFWWCIRRKGGAVARIRYT